MTFERNPAPPAEPAPISSPSIGDEPTPVQIRLQILSTEHWSLLASRGLAWNESFTRAGMYLSTLSGAMVALGLIGGIDGFGAPFYVFALVILPIVLFVGITTVLRMGVANYHDATTVYGMNRIRGAYLEIAPELEPYFVMSAHDDPRGIGITMAVPPGTPTIVHIVSATPFLVIVLNGVVAGAIAALLLIRFVGAADLIALGGATIVAIVTIASQASYATRAIRRGQAGIHPLFPSPDGTDMGRVFGSGLPQPADATAAARDDGPQR